LSIKALRQQSLPSTSRRPPSRPTCRSVRPVLSTITWRASFTAAHAGFHWSSGARPPARRSRPASQTNTLKRGKRCAGRSSRPPTANRGHPAQESGVAIVPSLPTVHATAGDRAGARSSDLPPISDIVTASVASEGRVQPARSGAISTGDATPRGVLTWPSGGCPQAPVRAARVCRVFSPHWVPTGSVSKHSGSNT